MLYDPGSATLAGLAPAHFISIATPHLGCDSGFTEAQARARARAPGEVAE